MMNWRLFLLTLILQVSFFLLETPAHSDITGNDFLNSNPVFQLGYVIGIGQGIDIACIDTLEKQKVTCSFLPELTAMEKMTNEQLYEIFIKYLKDNPEFRHKKAKYLFRFCLKQMSKKLQKSQ